MKPSVLLPCLLALACALASAPARAEQTEGIVVTGTGEVLVKPNQLEINLTAAGAAELSGDAVVKYRDALTNTIAAFEKLKLKNLEIVQEGLGIQTEGGASAPGFVNVINGGEEAAPLKTRVGIARSLRLVLSDIDKLNEEDITSAVSRLLDTAKDTGAAVGESQAASVLARMYGQQTSNSMVTFVVAKADSVRQKAYQEAFRQAEDRAKELAGLARVKLGRVLAIEETPAVGEEEDPSATPWAFVSAMYGLGGGAGKRETRVVSDRLADIPVRVALRVRFAIQEKDGAP
jgi:uncharacterized protein YggE